MRKLTARWVPKSLSDEQIATRASVCSDLLKCFRSKDDFLLHLVTVHETWVHYYEPENKAQSHQWVGPGSPRPKKFKTQPSAGKVMATVFWNAKGIIMLDFLPKRSTITWVSYANLLDQLRTVALKVFCCNRTMQQSTLAMDTVEQNGYELIPHLAYSPDLAPSDFFLFQKLKKDICGHHFQSDEEVVTAVKECSMERTLTFSDWAYGTWTRLVEVHHTRGQLHRKRRGGSQREIS